MLIHRLHTRSRYTKAVLDTSKDVNFVLSPRKEFQFFRSPERIIQEVQFALDSGVQNVRLGGMTDTYTYMAEGVTELEYPIPNPNQ